MILSVVIILLVIAAAGMVAWRFRPVRELKVEVGPLAQRLRDASQGATRANPKDLS